MLKDAVDYYYLSLRSCSHETFTLQLIIYSLIIININHFYWYACIHIKIQIYINMDPLLISLHRFTVIYRR